MSQPELKRLFGRLRVAGVAIGIMLTGRAISTHYGTKYLYDVGASADEETGSADAGDEAAPGITAKVTKGAGAGVASLPPRAPLIDDVVARNPFCPTCREVVAVAPVEGSLEGPVKPGESRTALPLRLMATMEASDPEWSIATIFDADDGSIGPYRAGDLVRPGLLVMSVERGMVHLRNGSVLEYLEMGGVIPEPKKVDKAAAAKPGPKGKTIDGAADSINCPSENLCIVQRPFVEKVLGNFSMLAGQARIKPNVVNGETKGFKFSGIRSGSLPEMLGLKNGDIITEVNGDPLDSVDKAAGLYAKLRRASNLNVTVDRKGQTMSKEIQIK